VERLIARSTKAMPAYLLYFVKISIWHKFYRFPKAVSARTQYDG
jgi:hypothetical protein